MHGAAGASRTGGATDTSLIKKHERAFAFDALESDVGRIGQSIFAIAVDLRARHGFQDRLLRTGHAGLQPLQESSREVAGSELGRFSQPDDGGNILRASAAAVFLAAAQPWSEAHALIDIEGSHAFRAMQFVAGEGEELYAEIVEVEGKFADGLHGIDVKGNLSAIGDAGDLFESGKERRFRCWPTTR